MEPKMTSAIEQITLNTPTFHGCSVNPTYINFFFGKNGTGKSTVAKAIATNDGLTWQDGRSAEDYSVLLYNNDFIARNIQSYGNMPGVFTISAQSADEKRLIDEKTKKRDELLVKYNEAKKALDDKEKEKIALISAFETSIWNQTVDVRDGFDEIVKGKKKKHLFAAEVLKLTTAKDHDFQKIKNLYDLVFAGDLKPYQPFGNILETYLSHLPGALGLLTCPIVSSSQTPFAVFVKALNATDWIHHGHESFTEHADGKCPFCQQELPENFEQELAQLFDEQYAKDIATLSEISAKYDDLVYEISAVTAGGHHSILTGEDKETFSKGCMTLFQVVTANSIKIKDKVKEPSMVVEIFDVLPLVKELDEIAKRANIAIEEYNSIISSKQQKQIDCRNAVWELVLFRLQDEIASYRQSFANIEAEIADIRTQKNTFLEEGRAVRREINELNKNAVNTTETVESINGLLRDSGFQGFFLREKADIDNVYELVRNDDTIAANLSEGERNFIAFLYFYHLVRGTENAGGEMKDKIVVIDDPISSMDSGVLFIVSALVREMIEVCYNNTDYLDNQLKGDYIKQIFILTHNAFFHKEVTYSKVKHYRGASFYVIEKADNNSNIRLCVRRKESPATEWENYNPVQNSYAALWSEFKEVRSPIPVLNVIRRILEYYFLQLCGYDGASLRTTLLEKNKDKFIKQLENGQQDYSQYHAVAAMLSYISTSTTSITDGLDHIDDCMDVELCKETFEKVFRLMEQGQHYDMMMGNE